MEKFQQKLPHCLLIGKNVSFYPEQEPLENAEVSYDVMDNIEDDYYANTICQIIQLNVKTVDNSLISLLLYLVCINLKV